MLGEVGSVWCSPPLLVVSHLVVRCEVCADGGVCWCYSEVCWCAAVTKVCYISFTLV